MAASEQPEVTLEIVLRDVVHYHHFNLAELSKKGLRMVSSLLTWLLASRWVL
jgi:hypothetical protein